ncbi:MarR family transcriptional regulator [Cellulomonas chitinilytica]|uniref:MarR family transcriptional regulator n=1 Tax=Cellulomonas chitinilytica TaxID=398759 RepID=A0A919P057_9CELL|nr:MarR family winged helix-turn-helix transcriptional regulator [Cellulomonas chitinilytica]GIG19800.1 MarR family transcriptional regulator [Cellulomonas chitinilytica]
MEHPEVPAAPASPDPTSTDPAQWPVGRLLSAAARRVERDWDAHLAGWDLSHASQPALVHLARSPLSQRELAARCGVTEQTMSKVVGRLERTGYVTRAPHPDDRRRHVLSITGTGRQALVAASDRMAADALVTRGLTPEQVVHLRALLAVVARPDVSSGLA